MTAGLAIGLDHVAVVVPDLDAAEAAWRGLGFSLTPRAVHRDGAGAPTGTGNACAMLRRGYVELLAVVDPAKPSGTISRFLGRGAGIHVLSLATDDAAAAQARLGRAGFEVALAESERDGARFQRLPMTDADPRVQLIRQLNPELVWRPEFLAHPNRAVGLEAVVVADDPPARFATRLARAAGVPLVPDPLGGYVLNLRAGAVRVLPPEAVGVVFPGCVVPCMPWIAGIIVRAEAVPDRRLVEACGVRVLFTA